MAPRGRPKAKKFLPPATPSWIAPKALDHPSERAPDEPPAKKRQKRNEWNKIKGRKGAMEVFNSLPIDLIYLVCCNLDPADLFALSNTSKIFRAVVTGPSSKPLWVAARAKVGLPELELPLTDLQYAQLLFGKGCTFCERKNAGKPDPFIRARICGACSKQHFANTSTQPGVTAIQQITGDKLHPLTFSCCKPTNSGRYGPSYYLPEIARMSAWLYEQNFDADDHWRDRDYASYRRHRQPDQPEREPTTRFQKWFLETDGPRQARMTDGDKINTWLRSNDKEKAAGKDEIRKARLDEITRRFEEQGFDASEINHWEFLNDTVVRKPDPVTFRTWPRLEETLKPKLLDIRRRNRRNWFANAYPSLKRAHGEGKSFPSLEVFYQIPTIKSLLDDVSAYTKPSDLWDENLDAIVRDLKALLRTRREAMVKAVAQAHSALHSAQADEKAGKHVASVVKGLHYTAVTLPRLPPWIPRDPAAPIIASDEQIAVFLGTSPLACFECTDCKYGTDGATILGHLGQSYGCHSSVGFGQHLPTWARIDAPAENNSMKCDRDVMLIALKLKQLIDETPLDYREANVEKAAEGLSKEWQAPGKKYSVELKCDCAPYVGFYSGAYITRNVREMYSHIRRCHTHPDSRPIQISTKCDYSVGFRHAVNTTDPRLNPPRHYTLEEDIYAALGLGVSMAGAGFSDDDGPGAFGMTDEGEDEDDDEDEEEGINDDGEFWG